MGCQRVVSATGNINKPCYCGGRPNIDNAELFTLVEVFKKSYKYVELLNDY